MTSAHRGGHRAVRATLAACLAGALPITSPQATAQLEVRGYALGVGSYSASSELVAPGSSWFGRGRAMATYDRPDLTMEVAYEHVLQRASGGFGITSAGGQRVSTDWLPLEWTLTESDDASWRHRFDRLVIGTSRGPLEVTVGRQVISWATTLFLTPADPFAPFDPSDPFREYRGGVDAVRLRISSGPFTEIEGVVRAADTSTGSTLTALARVATSRGGWAMGGWAGILHHEAAGALFVTGGLGATSVRVETSLREDSEGGVLPRVSAGLDRFFRPGGKDLYALIELQYDGFGASAPEELLGVVASPAYGRGDMQVLGRWTAAAQASYDVHPLVRVDALALVNLDDGSLLFAPGLGWSTTASVSTRLGTFVGIGEEVRSGIAGALPALGSEYGSVPPLGYLSVAWYF